MRTGKRHRRHACSQAQTLGSAVLISQKCCRKQNEDPSPAGLFVTNTTSLDSSLCTCILPLYHPFRCPAQPNQRSTHRPDSVIEIPIIYSMYMYNVYEIHIAAESVSLNSTHHYHPC